MTYDTPTTTDSTTLELIEHAEAAALERRAQLAARVAAPDLVDGYIAEVESLAAGDLVRKLRNARYTKAQHGPIERQRVIEAGERLIRELEEGLRQYGRYVPPDDVPDYDLSTSPFVRRMAG